MAASGASGPGSTVAASGLQVWTVPDPCNDRRHRDRSDRSHRHAARFETPGSPSMPVARRPLARWLVGPVSPRPSPVSLRRVDARCGALQLITACCSKELYVTVGLVHSQVWTAPSTLGCDRPEVLCARAQVHSVSQSEHTSLDEAVSSVLASLRGPPTFGAWVACNASARCAVSLFDTRHSCILHSPSLAPSPYVHRIRRPSALTLPRMQVSFSARG